MRVLWTGIVALGLSLAGCAEATTTPSVEQSQSPSAPGASVGASEPASSSAAPAETQPASAPAEAEETITGQLGADDIEGGCVFVEAADGTRYEVLWPEGWTVDPSTLELSNPDGDVVAGGGDEITLGGSIDDDTGSICQIGPIFEALEVDVAD